MHGLDPLVNGLFIRVIRWGSVQIFQDELVSGQSHTKLWHMLYSSGSSCHEWERGDGALDGSVFESDTGFFCV